MILRLLTVIQAYVPQFARKATDLMLAFINAIAANVPRLVDGGMRAVIELINGVANSIRGNSSQLHAAGRNLASAIVEGMVGGITGGLSAVTGAARRLASSALDAAKGALGIRSPSREFAKVGNFSVKGLAKGLKDSSGVAERASEQVGHGTIEAMRKTLEGLSDAVGSHIDVDPTIRPVLDLTQVQADAVKMGALFGGQDIKVGSAFRNAKIAAADYSANRNAQEEMTLAGVGDKLTFNQYNSSPKALSEATIYRQTKNQISTAKGALKN